jgi:tellurite resistance protein TehA-like permease
VEADSESLLDRLGPRRLARITGGIYLTYVLASILAGALGQIGLGDAQQVQKAIVTNVGSFRIELVLALLTGLLFVVTAWGLYVLLRPVNPELALLFLLLNAVGVAIQGAAMLSLVSALLGDGPSHLQAYSSAQVEGLSYLAIDTYKTGWVTAQLFFGAWLFPLAYLVYRSRFLPRFLGVLLALDGIAVGIWFLQVLLFPDYPAIRYPGLAVSFVAEVGLALWLLLMGVRSVQHGGEPRTDPKASIRHGLP